jgi:hypothetical protein
LGAKTRERERERERERVVATHRRNVGESRRSIHPPGIVKHTKRDAPEDLKSGKRRVEKYRQPRNGIYICNLRERESMGQTNCEIG